MKKNDESAVHYATQMISWDEFIHIVGGEPLLYSCLCSTFGGDLLWKFSHYHIY